MTASLFTAKDMDLMTRAMASGQEISLTLSLLGLTMKASTCRASPVWDCDMLVRLERSCGGVYSSQYFRSVGEMERSI